jgi:hypothetical protein
VGTEFVAKISYQPNNAKNFVIILFFCIYFLVESHSHVFKLIQLYFMFRFHEIAAKSKDDLVALGFPHFTVEDFHDTVRI